MAHEILSDVVNKAPPRDAQAALGTTKEVGSMIREYNAEQGDLAKSAIMLKETFTIGSTFDPEASLLYICRWAMAEGITKHSLGTRSGLLTCPCSIAKEAKRNEILFSLAL